MITPRGPDSLLIVVPALNEEGAIGAVVQSIRSELPGVPILVIDDCSTDATVDLARAAGAEVVSLPRHLGLGGCVQTGYKLAFELGFHYVVRVDGDGQHDAADISRIYQRLRDSGAHMVIGSRFIERNGQRTTPLRGFGIVFFRWILRVVLGKPVHDPTSGFVGVNRIALQVFSRTFPLEYPEIEALVVLQRRRFRFEEVPCRMLPRTSGRSSITAMRSVYYIIHVLLGIVVNVLKYDARISRPPRERLMSRLLFFTSALSVLLFFLVLVSVRRSRIRVEYSVGWLFAAVALFMLSRSNWLLESAARVLHIDQPPVVLLLGVLGVLLLLFFWASILISQLRDDTVALVQRIAILEFQIRDLRQSVTEADGQIS